MKKHYVFPSLVLVISAMLLGCGTESDPASSGETSGAEQAENPAAAGLQAFFPSHDQIEGLTGTTLEYKQYDGETLFEYMNGGAEIYLGLGFESIGTKEFSTVLAVDIYLTIEIYDMSLEKNAKEIFSKNNAGTAASAGVGVESSIGGGTIEFWKDRYLVRVRCDDVGEAVDRLLRSTARFVEKSLEQAG